MRGPSHAEAIPRPSGRPAGTPFGRRRPTLWIAAAFIFGIAGQGLLPLWVWWALTAITLILATIALAPCPPEGVRPLLVKRGLTPSVLAALVGLGALAAAADQRVPADHVRWRLTTGPMSGVVEGIVVDDPVWRRRPERPVTQDATIALVALDGERASGRLQLRQRQPRFPLRYGDCVVAHGTLRPPRPAATAGAFDEARWLWQSSIDGVLEASRDEVEWVAPARGWRRDLRALFDFKHRALGIMAQRVDPLTAALLGTLLAGERTALPRAVTAAFTDTGTVHLLSVSGWHVTLIGGLLWAIAAICLPRRAAAIATIGGLLAYGILTGAQPPIVRATVAGCLVLAGICATRAADALNTLALAALAILVVSPRTLWMPAFQLSFASVAALLTLAPPALAAGRRWLVARDWQGWRFQCAWGIWQSLVISTAAWLATWPLVAYHLHRLSLVAALANLFAVPCAALVMVTGLVVVIGGWLHPWLVLPWVGAAQGLSHLLVAGLAWGARWPGAAVAMPALPWWGMLGWYAVLAGIAARVNHINNLVNTAENS